jgi:glycosyltransferase involved in cell wall biosynthesis
MSGASARVLFLTPAAFNKVSGGGITFSNLFAGWPLDAIATVHNDPVPVTRDVCNHYYRLGEGEIHRWGWLRHVPLGKPAAVMEEGSAPPPRRSWVFSVLKRVKTWVFGDGIPETAQLTPELEAWVAEFRPNVLYTILGSNGLMELAEQLRVRFRLPLVVHIMDDWVSVLYRGGLLSPWQRRKKERMFRHLMDVAAARFAIGDAMAEAYQCRYGQPFQSFQNAIEVKQWQRCEKDPGVVNHPVRVAYIGSILPFAQLDSLVDCCRAIQALADEGFSIGMEIYSPAWLAAQYRAQLVVGTEISLHDTLSDDTAFFDTLHAVDILVLPVNFDQYTVEFIRYSMPTKVPAYLAAGTPILAYGPAGVAQISYAAAAGWGLTVTARDGGQLQQAFRRLASDTALRAELSSHARATAAARHDAQVVRSGFQAALACAAAGPARFGQPDS